MKIRKAKIERKTRETRINVYLNLDKADSLKVEVNRSFIRHMLETFAFHAGFGLRIKAEEFSPPDDHHLVEDLGITLGQALDKALGSRTNIRRFGYAIIPMDDALVMTALDLSGRGVFESNLRFKRAFLGDLTSDLINHFMASLAYNGKFNLHILALRGEDDHHKAEAAFKALGLALSQAVGRVERKTPSLKGALKC